MTAAVNGPVLVTGASGFAGSHLVEQLSGTAELVAWSRSEPPPWLGAAARWQRVDLLVRDEVRAAIDALRPSAVYHCAGLPHVAESWAETAQPLAANVLATHYLLDALRRSSLDVRVLVTGSATVYGVSDRPIREEDALAPASPYALSKLAQEQLAIRAGTDDGVAVIVTRPFNHTGPRQKPEFAAPGMARQIALIERGEREPVIRVGNLDVRRDITDVRDTVRAYRALMQSGEPGLVYNVASGTARTIRSLLEQLIARAHVPVTIEVDPARLRPHDPPLVVGDATRLRQATGWAPLVPFDQTLDDLLDYWRSGPR